MNALQLDLLIGHGIYDDGGRKIGNVGEIRICREGDAYVVEGLLVGVQGWAERMGAGALATTVASLLHLGWLPAERLVYWEQVDRVEGKKVFLKVGLEDLEEIREGEAARRRTDGQQIGGQRGGER